MNLNDYLATQQFDNYIMDHYDRRDLNIFDLLDHVEAQARLKQVDLVIPDNYSTVVKILDNYIAEVLCELT